MKLKTQDVVLLGLMAAMLLVVQVTMAFLPNIELVSLLIIVYTLVFGKKTLYIIYTFALLEGVIYGFGVWWVMYLYIWTILFLITLFFKKNTSVLVWSMIAAFFGLAFGALGAIPYAVAGGIGAGIAWWGAGLLFDVVHGVSNFILVFLLFKPIYYVVERTSRINVEARRKTG